MSVPDSGALVDAYAASLSFALDPFQREAMVHLAEGRSVLVAAPTGTGKTVVAELAIWLARRAGQRAIYTAPLKALSNQKFRDLRALHGEAAVGLMTGDIVANPTAPIVVMTTEIYRNMLLEGSRAARHKHANADGLAPAGRQAHDAATEPSALADQASVTVPMPVAGPLAASELARQAQLDEELSSVGCVIFDELHYLSDPERGPVWEEAIIHSPAHVTFAGLSATVSNAEQLCQWITRVHGPTALVLHLERAVPLEHSFYLDGMLHLVQDATGQRVECFPNVGGEAKLARERNRGRAFVYEGGPDRAEGRAANGQGIGRDGRRQTQAPASKEQAEGQRPQRLAEAVSRDQVRANAPAAEMPVRREAPEPGEILTALRQAELLPCLYFLPGRRAVEAAAASAAAHLLITPEQRGRLHEEVQAWVSALPAEDQRLDQVRRLAALLPRGLAFHHAGLLPGLKVMVETLFQRGELRAVFATDTLALGINMPARSVVLGSLSKFDGTTMRLLTPNEYQQLTGRAGRRGMDRKGAAIILYSPWDAFEPAFAQLTSPLLPVISAFTVRYNTILNLWRPHDLERLRRAVAASLREYQRASVASDHAGRRQQRGRPGRSDDRPWLSRPALRELNATIWALRTLGYIDKDDELTVRGQLLRSLFHSAGIVLIELILAGTLDTFGPAEIAEAVSWFTFDDTRALRNLNTLSRKLLEARNAAFRAIRSVQAIEHGAELVLSPGISDDFYGIALNWWRGMSLGGLLRRVDLAEGDLLVALNQTIDLLQQVQSAVGQTLDAHDLWRSGGQARQETHARLEHLRSAVDAAWRGMLRGSVAQSRGIATMAAPRAEPPASSAAPGALDGVPLALAEDEDTAEARDDRVSE
jgi:superfamily II RNA helicase